MPSRDARRVVLLLIVMTCVAVLVSCAAPATIDRPAPDLTAMGKRIVAPASLPRRPIFPPTTGTSIGGEQVDLADGDYKFTLFIPDGYQVPADGHFDLTIHFHTEIWFAIEEHRRHGLKTPLVAVFMGGVSGNVYGQPFVQDPKLFDRMLDRTVAALKQRGAPASTTIDHIDITSFSAGYGAVREILKHPANVAKIRRIILCDSLFAAWETRDVPASRPAATQMSPFGEFADLAAQGKEKTLLFTHSSVHLRLNPSTPETAQWLIEHVGVTDEKIASTTEPVTDQFELISRADVGHFHVWGYNGTDTQAHLTHIRHLADLWKALDAAGEP